MNFGLSDSLEYTEFELDSFDCNESKNEQFYTTDWPNFYVGKPLNNVAAIKILEAQIPFTFYTINSSNCTFTLSEGGVANGATTVTLVQGNFNYSTLIPMLESALNAASVIIGNSWNYSVFYNQAQLNLTVHTVNAASANNSFFAFTFGQGLNDNGQTNARLALGFSGGFSASNIIPHSMVGVMNLTGQNAIQLSGPNYIYICSTALGSVVHLYLPGNGLLNPPGRGADGPQIAKLPMVVNPGQVVNWLDPNPLMWFDVGNTQFNGNIDFYCTLGVGSEQIPIEFNGVGFSLKLGVLTNQSSHNDYLGGGRQNNRVINRISGS